MALPKPRPELPPPINDGRPRILADHDKRRSLCAMIAVGAGLDAAARHVGCSIWTVQREAQRDEEFAKQLREANSTAELLPLQALRTAAKTNWRAAAWLLERTHPEQFARRKPDTYAPADIFKVLEDAVSVLLEECEDKTQLEQIRLRLLALLPPLDPAVS
ncbi:MAG: hypothetical protein RH917_10330 [Lacipirellulaceae bacterium]